MLFDCSFFDCSLFNHSLSLAILTVRTIDNCQLHSLQYLSWRVIIISCHQTIFFYRSVHAWAVSLTLEGHPKCRGVRGVSIATCEPCSLLPARIPLLCLRWNIPTSSFVLCFKCIQFLVCSGISSWAKGYHAPCLDPRTGWLSLHVPSPPVFSSIRWLGHFLLGSELVVHL